MATRTFLTGNARHKVIIETPTQGVDSPGGITWSWSTLATRWAVVRPAGNPLSAREAWGNFQNIGKQLYEVRIRYDATLRNITSDDRIKLSNYDSPETYRILRLVGPLQIVQERHHVVILIGELVEGDAQTI